MQERDRAIGQYRTGVAIGEEALPKHPRDLVLRRDLADLYTALGRCYESFDAKQAAEWYRKDSASGPSGRDWLPRPALTGIGGPRRSAILPEQIRRMIARQLFFALPLVCG
jgi:hypothetical protein